MAMQSAGTLLLVLLAAATGARAQDSPLDRHDLPRGVYERLRATVDDPRTARFDGPTRIGAGRTVAGDAVAQGGPLTLAGRIDGHLVVIGGDLVLEPGAAVDGDVTVVGGTAEGVETAAIGGSLTVYGEGFAAADDPEPRRDRLGYDPPWDDARWWNEEDDPRPGEDAYSRIVVRPGPSYNRVEGLPIRIGPEARTAGANPLRVRALGIVRTETGGGLDRDDIGYAVRAEQFLGGRRALRIGAGAYSVIEPIEAWSLRDMEAGLATFIAHADPRDHYERTGWNAFVRLAPRTLPLDATLEFRSDAYGLAGSQDPFTLLGDDPWRPQPLVATGTLRSVVGRVVVDSRDDAYFPTRGWYIETSVLRGVDGALSVPAFVAASAVDPGAPSPRRAFDSDVTHAFVDARHYERLPDALLGFRLVGGDSPTGDALPPQFQHALGGAGGMPGFGRFTLDCGARARRVLPAGGGAAYHPYYGCDRFVLFQAEYIGRFDIDFGWRDDGYDGGPWPDLWWGWRPTVAWAAFVDAGRGWTFLDDGDDALFATDTRASYDAGAGLLVGGVGLYAAVPLTGEDDDIRLTLRIGRRF